MDSRNVETILCQALLDNLRERDILSPRTSRGRFDGQEEHRSAGTLNLMILKAVSLGPLHRYGVLLRIRQISGEEPVIQQGSLYPELHRLEHQGAIASEWGESENNRKAKCYRLTRAGREWLGAEIEKWHRMAGIIGSILKATPGDE